MGSAGAWRTDRSIGRLQTHGTLTGARRATSASAVATMKEASRMALLHPAQAQHGARRVQAQSLSRRVLGSSKSLIGDGSSNVSLDFRASPHISAQFKWQQHKGLALGSVGYIHF